MSELTISVPASSANIGPGFDSVGVALNRYLTLQVVRHNKWSIIHNSTNLPSVTYENHLIYQIAKRTAEKHNKKLPPCQVKINSEIPLTRGLGSSAAAVIAGIELANQVCKLSLTAKQKLQNAIEFEGHADNVAAALFGGFIVTADTGGLAETNYIQLPPLNLDVVLYIPGFELKTTEARNILPTTFTRQEATKANGISNLMIASLLMENYEVAGQMMEQDLFHEPYRAKLIPHYDDIKQQAKENGAYGTVISGAGPTMISFVPKGKGATIIANKIKKILPGDYEVNKVKLDQHGIQVNRKN